MTVSCDLAPTDRLTGMHMVGTVVRRFLISYPVSPDKLQSFLPPGAELSLHNNMAWVSDCFVHMNDMHMHMMPACFGMGFNYLIHRTRARLPFPDGKLREAVLVLQPNINQPLLSTFGGLMTGVNFNNADINFSEDNDKWHITMHKNNELVYDADILKASVSESIPQNSQFENASSADDFLLGVSFGGQYTTGSSHLKLLPETHEPWTTLAGSAVIHKHAYAESLLGEPIIADHVITMTNIPHYFGITPLVSDLSKS